MTELAKTLEAALAVHAASLDVKEVEGVPFLIVPPGYDAKNLESLLPAPIRIRATVKVADGKSFVDYWQKFATDRSVIFANEEGRNFTAIFDYHLHDTHPDWCEHKASLTLTHSDEWKRWIGKNNQGMRQRDFAEFI